MKLFFDLETFSEVPIKNGTFSYAEKAEIMLFAWALDDGPISVWDLTADPVMPAELKKHLSDPNVLKIVHNLQFDRTILRETIGIDLPIEQCRCTMARALAHGLPGGLDILCDIFAVPIDKAKSKEGYKLVRQFCIPKPANQKLRRHTRETHPEDWRKFIEYARLDIEAMRVLDRKLPDWNYGSTELELWFLDQRINQRGVAVDIDLANAAIRAVERAQKKLEARTGEITKDEVRSTTQRDAMLGHILQVYGVTLPDLTMSTVERRLEDPELPIELKELLTIRLQASSTSTAKYAKLIKSVSADSRLRGTLQYCGAARTGRSAGRLMQLQNLPRPNLKNEVIDFGINALKADSEDLFFDDVMELTRNTIRGCLVAPPGRKLVISDLANIEGRVLPWLAGEQWKLDVFKAYDAGAGPDLYKLAYARAFRIKPEDVTSHMRQIGKVMELMLGYGGGCGAFITGAASYGIDLEQMAAGAIGDIAVGIRQEAENSWEWAVKEKRTLGLNKQVYVVCDSFKRMWRNAHPKIVKFWENLDIAAKKATATGGSYCGDLEFIFERNWLRIVLPSKRSICYPGARYDESQISYLGVRQYSRKWERIHTYAGKWAENITQAVARDVMFYAMPTIEKAGYQMVAHVHDEVITEAPDSSEFNANHLSKLLATNPSWALGLPLAAGGFESYRYRKE